MGTLPSKPRQLCTFVGKRRETRRREKIIGTPPSSYFLSTIHLFEMRQPPFSARAEKKEMKKHKGSNEKKRKRKRKRFFEVKIRRRCGGNWLLYAFFTVGHGRGRE
jgi:hypothetical protein